MRKPNGMTIKSAVLCLAALSLSSCAGGRTAGEHIADMPHWMGGLPADARRVAARRNTMHGWPRALRMRRGLRLNSSSLSRCYRSSSGCTQRDGFRRNRFLKPRSRPETNPGYQ